MPRPGSRSRSALLPDVPAPERRLVVTVCLRERGVVRLAVERGGRRRRLDAAAILRELTDVVARRDLTGAVVIREGCAGGCAGPGPNVDVRIFAAATPSGCGDAVALAWKTYVYSLATLPDLATVIDENLRASAHTTGPLSAASTPAAVFAQPAVTIAASAKTAGGAVTAAAPAQPPGTRHGRGSAGARARKARNAASSTRSVTE